jgi:hypothetical protein
MKFRIIDHELCVCEYGLGFISFFGGDLNSWSKTTSEGILIKIKLEANLNPPSFQPGFFVRPSEKGAGVSLSVLFENVQLNNSLIYIHTHIYIYYEGQFYCTCRTTWIISYTEHRQRFIYLSRHDVSIIGHCPR